LFDGNKTAFAATRHVPRAINTYKKWHLFTALCKTVTGFKGGCFTAKGKLAEKGRENK